MDTLNGDAGNDTLDGGLGNDSLTGGAGNDTYRFAKGDGQDSINYDYDTAVGKLNVLEFKAGISASEVVVTRSGSNLVLSIAGTTDKVTVGYFFNGDDAGNAYNAVQQVKFADGTTWDTTALTTKALEGTAGNDTITGTVIADVINAGSGNDTVSGMAGNDTLNGDAGTDTLYGGDGADTLSGGADADTLTGEAGNDTLDGGLGNDSLSGGTGNDTYLFGKGDGQDTITNDYDLGTGKLNVLQFKAGITPGEIVATRLNGDLILTIAGTTDKVTVGYFFSGEDTANGHNSIQQVKFADGTSWDIALLTAKVFAGTAGNDTITGTLNADTINGGAGLDTLNGGSGNDTLIGSQGNDNLTGSTGSDIYTFAQGDGQDVINNYDTNSASVDVAHFDNATIEDLWFSKSGNDLLISRVGFDDKVTVSNWYSGAAYQLDKIEAGSAVLMNAQIAQLVTAMAAFAPPAGAGSIISQDVKDQLHPVLAASWQ